MLLGTCICTCKTQAHAEVITAACRSPQSTHLHESLISYDYLCVVLFTFKCISPGCDVDVLQQAGEAVRQGDAERPQQVVPAGLHVFTGPALSITLTAHILMVRSHYVGDEVVVPTGCLEGERAAAFSLKGCQRESDLRLSTGADTIQLHIR